MKKLNLIRSSIALLCMVLFAFIFSCKENDNQIAPVVHVDDREETEINTIDLGVDPDFVGDENKSGRIASVDVVRVGVIRAYVNRMEGAEGKVSIRVYRTSDNAEVSRSGRKNVSELTVHSPASIKYTNLWYTVNVDFERNQEYRMEVLCEGCAPNDSQKAVHWLSSNGNAYADGLMITPFGDMLSNFDLTFSVESTTPEGQWYKSASNTKRVTAYAINVGNMKAAQTFKAHIPFDYNTACLLQDESSTAEAVVFAGSPTEAGNVNGQGTAARFGATRDLTIDMDDNLYISDLTNGSIRKIDPSGNVTTAVTDAVRPDLDLQRNLYYVTPSSQYKKLYKRTPAGTVTLIATLPTAVWDLTVDNSDNVFVLLATTEADDDWQVIQKISSNGVISTLAGSYGNSGSADGQGGAARFDFGPSVSSDVVYDEVNNLLYVIDRNGLRKITMNGTVTTIPVNWNSGGLAVTIIGITVDRNGNVYLETTNPNSSSCKLQPNGDCCPVITTGYYMAVSSNGTMFYSSGSAPKAIYKVVTK